MAQTAVLRHDGYSCKLQYNRKQPGYPENHAKLDFEMDSAIIGDGVPVCPDPPRIRREKDFFELR
jgi:hypothetical protein